MNLAFDKALDAIVDGDPIDWAALEAVVETRRERVALMRLRALAEVLESQAPSVQQVDGGLPAGHWGHLNLLDEIGRGTSGVVYHAWDTRLERDVALKLFEEGDYHASLREAQRLARVKHPGVVTIHGADERDGRVGLWMELLRGQTLASIVRDRGPFSEREAIGVGVELCAAIAAIHSAGLVHRDIKAQNVIRERGGRIVLMDLGSSSASGSRSSLVGTPLYMAPELFDGSTASPQSDIYALGVLLYHLATASYPMDVSSLDDARGRAGEQGFRPIRELRAELSSHFVATVERCLAPDPHRRFTSASDLERALAPKEARASRHERRRSLLLGALATIACVVAFWFWQVDDVRPESVGSTPPNHYALYAGYEELAAERLEDAPLVAASAIRSAMDLARPGLPGHSGQLMLLHLRLAEALRRAGDIADARNALADAKAHATSVVGSDDPLRSLVLLEEARIAEVVGEQSHARALRTSATALRRATFGSHEPSTGRESGFGTFIMDARHRPATLGWQSHDRFPFVATVERERHEGLHFEAREAMAYLYQRVSPALTRRALERGFSLFFKVQPEQGLTMLAFDTAPAGPRFDVLVRRVTSETLEFRLPRSIVPREGPVVSVPVTPATPLVVELRLDRITRKALLNIGGVDVLRDYEGHTQYQDPHAGVVSWGVARHDSEDSSPPAATIHFVWLEIH